MTLEQLEKKLEKLEMALTSIEKEVPKKVANEYKQVYRDFLESSIATFYWGYTPRIYQRTDNFRSFPGASEVIVSGNAITVIYSTSAMSPFLYTDPVDYVAHGAFDLGIHGTSQTGGVSSPTPREMFVEKSETFLSETMRYEIKKRLKGVM